MITTDYTKCKIDISELSFLREFADVKLRDLLAEGKSNLLIFPDTLDYFDENLGNKSICAIDESGQNIITNSIVGFVGKRGHTLTIYSRFAAKDSSDFFIHYMLSKVTGINILDLPHTSEQDQALDYLMFLFPKLLKTALTQGLYRNYVKNQYNDAKIRGNIDIPRHLRQNMPFNGRVAYSAREHSFDNPITQLIRHAIEYISQSNMGSSILQNDRSIKEAINIIKQATSTYSPKQRQNIIQQNLKPLRHPYFTSYRPLQKLCMQILRHENLKYGNSRELLYGILVDAAWLWEEYLAILLKDNFSHIHKRLHRRFYLFANNKQRIIPDYLSHDQKLVADAKYIRLNERDSYSENSERANAIYYKTIAYMYRFAAAKALLFYPHPDQDTYPEKLPLAGDYGGCIYKVGVQIPSQCNTFREFACRMDLHEKRFIEQLKDLF